MRRTLSLAVAGLLAAGAASAHGEVLARTLEQGAARRSYLLYVPERPAAPAAGRPLLVALHGGGGTAEQMMAFSRFNRIAAREGFAVAYPQGVDRRWNDGRVFRGRGETDADDVAFVRAMAADLGPRCAPTAPVAVLVINGTADPLVPYAGGHVRAMFGLRGEIWSTDRTIAFWARHNGCAAPPVVRALADRDTGDGSHVIETDHGRCAAARVRLLRVEGGGHTWPGGAQYLPAAWIGTTNRDIDASETIWRFFASAAR